MAVIEAVVGAGVGVASMALSVAMQVLASGGQTATAGLGKRHRTGGKAGGGVTGAINGALSKLEMPRLHIAMFTAGGVGLAGTGLGNLISACTTWANQTAAHLMTDWVGIGLGWLVSVGAAVILLMDVRDDKCTPRTLALAATMPFFVAAIPGKVGDGAATAISAVARFIGHLVASAFGMQ